MLHTFYYSFLWNYVNQDRECHKDESMELTFWLATQSINIFEACDPNVDEIFYTEDNSKIEIKY